MAVRARSKFSFICLRAHDDLNKVYGSLLDSGELKEKKTETLLTEFISHIVCVCERERLSMLYVFVCLCGSL